jgi:hypothetical protein
MSVVAAAVVGSALVGAYSAKKQGDAAQNAAESQSQASAAGIAEQRRQFNAIQKLLKPYVRAGAGALEGQEDLLGLNGVAGQQDAIAALRGSPQYRALVDQGENAILQNASATGGLRGGNTQAALAQFRPALLSQLIDQQYSRLGGLVSVGQNSAAGVGNAGLQTGTNIANLLQQQGAALAGGALAQGRAQAGYGSAITGALGLYAGLGGFRQAPADNFNYGAIGSGYGGADYSLGGKF